MKMFFALFLMLLFPAVVQAEDQKWNPLKILPTDIVFGSHDAPVTIVEYASLTCPHCATFHKETWPSLKKDWIMPGKVKLVFRSMAGDQSALAGAMTAICVPNEHKEAVITALFDTTVGWATDNSKIAPLLHNRLGSEFNPGNVIKCMEQENLALQIMAPMADAIENGVTSTPTFFVNSSRVEGVKKPTELGAIIEAEFEKLGH